MRDVGRRLNAIEKRLRLGRDSEGRLPAVTQIGQGPTAEDERRPGPVETWTTYQEQAQPQEKADGAYQDGVPRVIVLSLDANEEARRRSERKCMT